MIMGSFVPYKVKPPLQGTDGDSDKLRMGPQTQVEVCKGLPF